VTTDEEIRTLMRAIERQPDDILTKTEEERT
jgi:hypothetical protein